MCIRDSPEGATEASLSKFLVGGGCRHAAVEGLGPLPPGGHPPPLFWFGLRRLRGCGRSAQGPAGVLPGLGPLLGQLWREEHVELVEAQAAESGAAAGTPEVSWGPTRGELFGSRFLVGGAASRPPIRSSSARQLSDAATLCMAGCIQAFGLNAEEANELGRGLRVRPPASAEHGVNVS
eukprot:9466212-Pyramimonas_sp.AAC.1